MNMTEIPNYIPVLTHGGHSDPTQGACVMEMVSFITGEKWTDHPKSVYGAIAEVARNTNDFVSDDNRSLIADMIPRFIGTNEIEKDAKARDRYKELLAVKLAAHPELEPFKAYGIRPASMLSAVRKHFEEEADLNKRYTNEQYDKFAMTILEVALDTADEILERGNYAITKEEAFKIVAKLPDQKRARV